MEFLIFIALFIFFSFGLFQGRVSTSDVFGVSNSDLVPGKYEGDAFLIDLSASFELVDFNSNIKWAALFCFLFFFCLFFFVFLLNFRRFEVVGRFN